MKLPLFILFVFIAIGLYSQCPVLADFTSSSITITGGNDCSLDINDILGLTSNSDITIESGASLTINFTGGLTIWRHNDGAFAINGTLNVENGSLIVDNLTANPFMTIPSGGVVNVRDVNFSLGSDGESNTVNLNLSGRLEVPSGTFSFWDDGVLTGSGCYEVNVFTNEGDDTSFIASGGGACSPAPVELLSFETRKIRNTVELAWVTVAEINNLGFEVQKSFNGVEFEKIGFVDGNGNSSLKLTYHFSDSEKLTKSVYYRLKQIDFDGASEYGPIRFVEKDDFESSIGVYPTVVKSNIRFVGSTNSFYQMQVLNFSGKLFTKVAKPMSLQELEKELNKSIKNYPAATYIIQLITSDQRIQTLKFIKR